MTRGQIQQLFIFLAAVLVIGATIFIAARLIGTLQGTACEAGDVTFMREVSDMLEQNSVFGSRSAVQLHSPCDATAICFVDSEAIGKPSFRGSDATITAVVQQGSLTNIFLQSKDGTVAAGYDERIILRAPSEQFKAADFCVSSSDGTFSFSAAGYGRYVRLQP